MNTSTTTVELAQPVLGHNDRAAEANASRLHIHGILALNLMASPGAGKTTLILATALHPDFRLRTGVIEGDLATRIDADRIAAAGFAVTQINTDGGCHLDADMVARGLDGLPLDTIDVLFVENVGNLVCPAHFALGTRINVVFGSVPEGHDKPYKYPGIYAVADVVVVTKADLLPYMEFDADAFVAGVRLVNRTAPVFVLSCRTGEGMGPWIDWLRATWAESRQRIHAG
jgi:hydrogenase nickel incorporation protein HypB